jgi:hypothetical protein
MSYGFYNDWQSLTGFTATKDPMQLNLSHDELSKQLSLKALEMDQAVYLSMLEDERIERQRMTLWLDPDRQLTGKFTDYLTTWQEGPVE